MIYEYETFQISAKHNISMAWLTSQTGVHTMECDDLKRHLGESEKEEDYERKN